MYWKIIVFIMSLTNLGYSFLMHISNTHGLYCKTRNSNTFIVNRDVSLAVFSQNHTNIESESDKNENITHIDIIEK